MITLTGSGLTLGQLKRIVIGKEKVCLCPEAVNKVKQSRAAVEQIIADGRTAYGINTGFGKFSDVTIHSEHTEALQLHLVRSHACGLGEPFSEEVARAMAVLRLNALLKGHSGIRPVVLERLRDMVNLGISAVIPNQGSLGASGDLAPLAHLALALIGEGEVTLDGITLPAGQAWEKKGIRPVRLRAKEGLALINGTQAMTACGALAFLEAEQLAMQSEWIAGLTIEALRGITDAFHPAVHAARGYPEQAAVAERMRDWLDGSRLTTRQGEMRVQDAYSIRCIPQVHGATWQVLGYVREKLEIEMNAATDNPLIFDDGENVISGGNFHGQPVAFAMDFLKIGMSELANISERRTERLVNPQLSAGLPPFLSPEPGLQSGAMILQYAAASIVSENKTLAHPASVDSIPSSANQEDHVSMGTIAARHAARIVGNVRRVLAVEAFCAFQACGIRGEEKLSPPLRQKWGVLAGFVPSLTEDRIFSKDIAKIERWLLEEARKPDPHSDTADGS
ncbi:histidine ammonia-lyase [Bhargavaea beijingensis]|uniref:histidine ammonia-lyase n=1 Tax=Bhargavaea beijingensis TaxID=426756 RepID=UPI00222467C1|nr:histidine ammonia-lyase [Bhargavaea beijingensis]MCW1927583.1 histidine ammonia-lyase [Bhargavaea beijingensis]